MSHDAWLVGGIFVMVRKSNSVCRRSRLAIVAWSSAFGMAVTLQRSLG